MSRVYEETRFRCYLLVPDWLTFVVNNGVGRLSQLYTNFRVGFGTKTSDFQISDFQISDWHEFHISYFRLSRNLKSEI